MAVVLLTEGPAYTRSATPSDPEENFGGQPTILLAIWKECSSHLVTSTIGERPLPYVSNETIGNKSSQHQDDVILPSNSLKPLR